MKYYIVGIICLVIALIFGLFCQVKVGIPNPSGGMMAGWAPNVTNAGASLGFALAGGLCMIASVFNQKNQMGKKN